jgi:hypothetical protein
LYGGGGCGAWASNGGVGSGSNGANGIIILQFTN